VSGGSASKIISQVIVASGTSHMRDSLQTILGSAELLHVVRVVATGSQLLEALGNTRADIVVIDGDIPGLNPDELEKQASSGPHVVYINACCPDDISRVVERMGGLVIDRCIGASEFLKKVLELTPD